MPINLNKSGCSKRKYHILHFFVKNADNSLNTPRDIYIDKLLLLKVFMLQLIAIRG